MAIRILIGCHILAGLAATLTGAGAMLAPKRAGPHPRRGRTYLIALTVLVVTGSAIALSDWAHLWHLAALGAAAATLAGLGYTARRIRYPGWLAVHITGMAGAYITMLTAFYVDNGPRLPLWNQLPPQSFWILPTAVGVPLLVGALHRHVRQPRKPGRQAGLT
jgi:hypothetical protein